MPRLGHGRSITENDIKSAESGLAEVGVAKAAAFALTTPAGSQSFDFLFPSLHDEGSWAVAEAVSWGLPAVTLDRGGTAFLATRTVRAASTQDTVEGLARAIEAVRGTVPATPPLDMASRRRDLAALLRAAGLI